MLSRETVLKILDKAREAYSFREFYSQYLERLADTKALRKELEWWRGRFKR